MTEIRETRKAFVDKLECDKLCAIAVHGKHDHELVYKMDSLKCPPCNIN